MGHVPSVDRIPAPLRIAFCIDNMNIGGTELNAVRTASRLISSGVDLSVFSLNGDGPLMERYAALGIQVEVLELGRLYGRNALAMGRRLQGRLAALHIQVLHAHDFYSNIFAAPWARLAGVKFIASRRWWEGPDRKAKRWANRASYLLAHRVLANSEGVGKLLTSEERVPSSAVAVVRNFLDEAAFAPPPHGWIEKVSEELRLPAVRKVVGVVASLGEIKDHATLIRAIAMLTPSYPDLYLVLVGGDAGWRDNLVRLVSQVDLEARVRFAGLRPSQPSMHHLFDISALTSTSEGLPNSILEAMAAGRPVVATAVGAIPDAVVHGVTGLLAPPGNPLAVAGALSKLLDDPILRASLGAAARKRALERYAPESAILSLIALYRSLATPEPFRR